MEGSNLMEFILAFPNNDLNGVPCSKGDKVYAPNLDMVRSGQFLSEKEYKKLVSPPKPKAPPKAKEK